MNANKSESPWARYVPLLTWVVVIATLLFIALKVGVAYNYMPGGDARRHVAKAFTDRTYQEIIVLTPEYGTDQSPGWDWILHRLQVATGWSADKLISFSVVSLLLCVFCAALPFVRRPEAWLLALLAQMIAIPELMTRWTQARPFLITEAVLIAILFAWSRAGEKISPLKVILTTIGIALSVCIHGTWYLWALPLAAFFLAGAWRRLVSLTCCVMAGVLLGGLMTGKPFVFLEASVSMVTLVFKEHVPQWMLVGEFQPSYGEFATVMLVALVYLWRRQRIAAEPKWFRQPVVWMFVMCWILGFKADRFWADWGLPAVLVWLTFQFEEILEGIWSVASPRRVDFMNEIAGMTKDIVNKAEQQESDTVPGDFGPLKVRCPKCSGEIKENYKKFQCQKCDFALWKIVAGRQLEISEVEELIEKKVVGPLQGFRSKLGKPFAAVIKLSPDFKPEFDFGQGQSTNPGGSAKGMDLTGLEPIGKCPNLGCGGRVILCALVAAPLFLDATNDLGRRYTNCLEETFLNGADPALKGWVPDDHGIFYTAQMDCFYNTFYANPTAPWRYVLGMEPAMMTQENLEIFRGIQRAHYAYGAYQPWVEKIKKNPEDRMMILSGGQPNLPDLEWTNAAGNIWIGRPPRAKAK